MSTGVFKSHCVDGVAPAVHALNMAEKRKRLYLREWRTFRGKTQEDLAEAIGKSGAIVSLMERGLSSVTVDQLTEIADVLDCSLVDLLTRAPQEADHILPLWDEATPDQRRTIVAMSKALLGGSKGQ